MSDLIKQQQPPQPAEGDVWLLVLKDMEERRKHGIEKYGAPVQPFNGRDAMIDAYQEALDLCVYLRQAIEEIKILRVEVNRLKYRLNHQTVEDEENCRKGLHKDCGK